MMVPDSVVASAVGGAKRMSLYEKSRLVSSLYLRGIYVAALLRRWPLHRVAARVTAPDRLGLPSKHGLAPEAVGDLVSAVITWWSLPFTSRCLVRSFLLYALLHDRSRVEMIIGFRAPGTGQRAVEGHAWIAVEGRPLLAADLHARDVFSPVFVLPRGGDGPQRGSR